MNLDWEAVTWFAITVAIPLAALAAVFIHEERSKK